MSKNMIVGFHQVGGDNVFLDIDQYDLMHKMTR